MRALLLVAAMVLAGCASDAGDESPTGSDADRVTDPSDYGYLDDPNATGRPHVHDYWNGATRHVALEEDFSMGGPDCSSRRYNVDEEHPGWIVRPGTRWVNVTVEWTSDGDPGRLGLRWVSQNRSESGNTTLENGVAYPIPTTDDMNDLPHSQTTRWGMRLEFDPDSFICPSVDVSLRIEIARPPGPLPLAPPHPDFWGDGTTIVLHDSRGKLDDAAWSTSRSRPPTGTSLDRFPNIIPPQTDRIQVKLWYNSSTDPKLHYNPTLDWLGADWRTGDRAMEPTDQQRDHEGFFVWEIDVDANLWDSPYDNRTKWHLWPEWPEYVYPLVPEPYAMEGDYHYQVRIERDG